MSLYVITIALIFAMGWNRYLSLDTVRDHGAFLRGFVADNYLLSLLLLESAAPRSWDRSWQDEEVSDSYDQFGLRGQAGH